MKGIKNIFTALILMLSLLFYNFMFATEEEVTIGVIDRVEAAGIAVVLIEAESKQIELTLEEFEEEFKEGDVLQLRRKAAGYEVIRVDGKLTNERKLRANQLLQKIQE